MPAILRSIKLDDVPYFQHLCSFVSLDWDDPLWQQTAGGGIRIRLQDDVLEHSSASVLMLPDSEQQRWRRAYHIRSWYSTDPFPVADFPSLGARLTYLRMENRYLDSFLSDTLPPLDALRALQIDFHPGGKEAAMVWPPDWADENGNRHEYSPVDRSAPAFPEDSYIYVRCAALERLTLYAFDAAMVVESQEAAFLGSALSQRARPKQDRAGLELIGIGLKTPVASDLLDQTFSSVRELGLAGCASRKAAKEYVWDEDW
ncbi:hypothetical protein AURDEDRAFT_113469 [Auricularia subglabra TFB-10046 SS5]|nr:hypothetical protein AURDEDRAFT_113469 [Auricularia subglabra TFB-10046 SS5]